MATTKSVKNEAIHAARTAVYAVQERLNKLHSDFEVEKRNREDLMKSLEYQLSNCRNGVEREPLHQRIEAEKKETIAIFKVWQKDIYECGIELVDKNSDLRCLVNSIYEKEYKKFKDSLDMNAAFRAFAFHRQTFKGGKWSDFLHSLFREPMASEIDAFADEIDALVE